MTRMEAIGDLQVLGDLPVLFVGAVERPEFREAVRLLREECPFAAVPSLRDALVELEHGEAVAPGLVVLAQSWPGEFSVEDVERLRRRAPLARLVGLLGPWCEGESRSGRPCPGVPRLYWHQWAAQARRQLRLLSEGRTGVWGLPPTATVEERLLWAERAGQAHVAAGKQPARSAPIVVRTSNWSLADMVLSACRVWGCDGLWDRPGRELATVEAAAGLWFGDQGIERRDDREPPDDLARFVARLGGARVVAALGFPRIDDVRQAQAAGAAAVVSLPLVLDELREALGV